MSQMSQWDALLYILGCAARFGVNRSITKIAQLHKRKAVFSSFESIVSAFLLSIRLHLTRKLHVLNCILWIGGGEGIWRWLE